MSMDIFLCKSSDEDLIFLGQVSMGIKKGFVKEDKRIFVVRMKHLEKRQH